MRAQYPGNKGKGIRVKVNSLAFAQGLFKGFAASSAPGIVKGMLSEWLKTSNIDFKTVNLAVKTQMRLWPLLPSSYYPGIHNILKVTGNLDWLTADWLIDVAREAHPPMASLFLGDDKAHDWLVAQVEDCKKELAALKAKS